MAHNNAHPRFHPDLTGKTLCIHAQGYRIRYTVAPAYNVHFRYVTTHQGFVAGGFQRRFDWSVKPVSELTMMGYYGHILLYLQVR